MIRETTPPVDIVRITSVEASVYRIPTETPEQDGTLTWNDTTLILVKVAGGGRAGTGYTYGHPAAAVLINDTLATLVTGKNLFDIPAIFQSMVSAIRNNGTSGIAMIAVSGVDTALWDLKARVLEQPLCSIFGRARNGMLLYGSGGFTNYSDTQLTAQFRHWEDSGIKAMKMKIGAQPASDVKRVEMARRSLHVSTALFVDANGAYTARQALSLAAKFAEYDVSWFEEPVRSSNTEGLKFIRNHLPAGMQVAAGEYGFYADDFKTLLSGFAVDVLQADATRCGGFTGFLQAGMMAAAWQIPFSSHCAPSFHLHAAIALPGFYIAEYFFDHARIEEMLFDRAITVQDGYMEPDTSVPGCGLEFKYKDAEKFLVSSYS